MSALMAFHFLRPLWLLALPPVWVTTWRLLRRADGAAAWHGLVAPHLLPHLLVGDDAQRRALGPVWMLAVAWTIGFVALAGPAWQREPAPFAEDQGALVIVLKVAPSMLARDVRPSRLERAVQKIIDLADRRGGARTALIAYAGSAHRVMPLTRDARIITHFARELAPDLMPRDGDEPLAALALALDELERAGVPGSVLLLTDALPVASMTEISARALALGASLHVLAVAGGPEVVPPAGGPAAPALDRDAGRRGARALGASWTEVTVDDGDLRDVARRFEQRMAQATGQETKWRDAGYPLVMLAALLALPWFRRGWRVEAI